LILLKVGLAEKCCCASVLQSAPLMELRFCPSVPIQDGADIMRGSRVAARDLDIVRCACLRQRIEEVSQATRARLAEVAAELRRDSGLAPAFEETARKLEHLADDCA